MSNIDEFFSTVTVLDTETTHLHAEQAEIVEIASARKIDNQWKCVGLLLGANQGIPPAASAKNNISKKMIQGLPTFSEKTDEIKDLLSWPQNHWYVAHNARYDREVLAMAWIEAGDDASVDICTDQSRWICTWRLSRQLLSHEYTDCEYGLNFLRYFLELPVPDNLRLHRADDDSYLCAVLLEYLIDYAVQKGFVDPASDIGTQLNMLCWGPINQTVWPFGKNRGKKLVDIPDDYYAWALKNVSALHEDSPDYDFDLTESVRKILESRILNG
jgi:DNA polymerase III epsilon subunit-like protein